MRQTLVLCGLVFSVLFFASLPVLGQEESATTEDCAGVVEEIYFADVLTDINTLQEAIEATDCEEELEIVTAETFTGNKCYDEWDWCNDGTEDEQAYWWNAGWCTAAIEIGLVGGAVGDCTSSPWDNVTPSCFKIDENPNIDVEGFVGVSDITDESYIAVRPDSFPFQWFLQSETCESGLTFVVFGTFGDPQGIIISGFLLEVP